ncbi:MAG: metal ABC transporter permease [Candidatus Eisenbacteria bacterium]|jgi:manganese/iron transport system permease protein|nr:metal ABC transporter permease [Candidatus Eisenbacteria bacterium]
MLDLVTEGFARAVLEPFSYPFMVRGLLAAVTVGAVCGMVGTFVVLRGMAFLGDALAHAILPGVATAYLCGATQRGTLFWWALLTAVGASLGVGAISRSERIREDTAIGIVFAGMFALGIALISTMKSYTVDLAHVLFGNVLQVSWAHLRTMWTCSGVVVLLMVSFYKEMVVLSFDPVFASTLRLPSRFLHYLMLVLIAVVIVVSLQTVGVALAVAMLVTPAATASLLTGRLRRMMALAAGLGAASGVAGLYLSYYLSMAPGAAMVLVATACFLVAFAISRRRRIPTTRSG